MSVIEKILIFGICFPLLFCGVGGFFARNGYIHFKEKIDKKRRCLTQTMGKIVDISSMTTTVNHKRRISYFPTYEYVVNNEIIRIEVKMGTSRCQYKIGDEVQIWYDAVSSHYSYIDSYKEDSIAAIVCLVLGSFAVLGGLYVGITACLG